MALTKLVFRPGINRETTDYSNEGGWWDCDLVRFRAGKPETIGGWTKYTQTPFAGTARALLSWTALDGATFSGLGTNLKYYIIQGGGLYDITPIRETTTAGAVTFAATNGSAVITVSDTGHGATLNDFVTFSGAVSLGGNVTAARLNTEHQITRIVNSNSYEITLSVTANASDSGNGGASVVGAYQINTGLDTTVLGGGWGAGGWSRGTWGSGTTISTAVSQLRLWSHDNFGEDLLFNVLDGGIYYWDRTLGTGTRAVPLSSLSGASAVPTIARSVLVSERDRHAIAFGCDPEGASGQQDPLTIRFSDQENIAEWASTSLTTAGELRISSGSVIVCAVQTKQQILVLTDISAHAMQYLGAPYTYGIQEVSASISIMSPNAAVPVGDAVFWMGKGTFYLYNGAVSQLPCDVKEFVFSDFNNSQTMKVTAGHNGAFSEVWWFYPSANSFENNRYVVFNYEQNIWYYGAMPRTTWVDKGVIENPVAASPDGYLYYQDFGLNDGSANPPAPLSAYVQSSAISIGEGDQFGFVTRMIPDITFRNSTSVNSTVSMTLQVRNFPGGTYFAENDRSVIKTASYPVEQFTQQVYTRLRGRSLAFRLSSAEVNTAWRLGEPRVDIRTDGRK